MKLTAAMQRFLKDDVVPNYIIYSRDEQYAYCTHCQKEVTIEFKGTRPGRKIQCPSCKKMTTLKAKGKTKNSFFDSGVGIIMEKLDEVIIHYYDVNKTYRKDGTLAYCDIHECLRESFDNNGFIEAWDNSWSYGWKKCNVHDYATYYTAKGEPVYHINTNWQHTNIYTKNIKDVIVGTAWEKSCMDGIFKLKTENYYWRNIRNFLLGYLKTQMDEYLYKVGFYELVSCSVFGYLPERSSEKTLPEMLMVSKENYKAMLKQGNPTYDELRKRQRMTQYNFPECDWEIFRKYFEDHSYYDPFGTTIWDEIKKYFPKTLHQFGKYANTIPGFDTKYYRDYLDMCHQLGYDLNNTFVLFPRDLHQAHDLCVDAINRRNERKAKREARKQAKNYESLRQKYVEQYSYDKGNLSIIVPEDTEAISKEGQALRHCVGSYVSRVANGETIILFVRRKKSLGKSYYTMEVQNGEIVQCRGFKNDDCNAEVKRFIKSFAKDTHLRMRDIA